MANKTALIFGVSGQDGSYLARLLIQKGYRVCGTTRNSPNSNLENLSKLQIHQDVEIRTLNLNNQTNIQSILNTVQPDEVYNLTGPSSVAASFKHPEHTYQTIFGNSLNCLDAIKNVNRPIRYYNACSSECFGNTGSVAANEMSLFQPLSPYASAKAAAYWLTQEYRSAYGLFASSGILFNHESPLRNSAFVTQKIIQGAKDIVTQKLDYLTLGNLDVRRDWGWAPDYVKGMHKILNHDRADDFVLATGTSNSLTQFLELAFQYHGLDWREYVNEGHHYIRESDVASSLGDPSKAKSILGWSSTSSLSDIVKRMIDAT
jgi:GDPmannose 4,6-dehydratase